VLEVLRAHDTRATFFTLGWIAERYPEMIRRIVDAGHELASHGYEHRRATDQGYGEFLADIRTGHNVVATVFMECHSMYRAKGPEAMRPVGETEFVAGQAAMSDSGMYGSTRVAAGIVGFADLTLGERVEPVLEAHLRAGGGRFRPSAPGQANRSIPRSQVIELTENAAQACV